MMAMGNRPSVDRAASVSQHTCERLRLALHLFRFVATKPQDNRLCGPF